MKHMLASLPFCLFALTAACSSNEANEAPATPYVCDAGELAIDEQGLTFATACPGTPMVPQDAFPTELPEYLTNSVVDQSSRQSRHVLPSVWSSPSLRMGINFTNEDKTIEGTQVPARSPARLGSDG